MSIGNFLESLSQAILVGIMLVGRLGVVRSVSYRRQRDMVRAPVFCGNLQEKTVFHECLQEACFVLTLISESLRNLPGVKGECNLGILYFSSLLFMPRRLFGQRTRLETSSWTREWCTCFNPEWLTSSWGLCLCESIRDSWLSPVLKFLRRHGPTYTSYKSCDHNYST